AGSSPLLTIRLTASYAAIQEPASPLRLVLGWLCPASYNQNTAEAQAVFSPTFPQTYGISSLPDQT
ncbi:MAG: hypothetical protein J0652_03355, partial [Desulfobulbaceae bacterium]|nr:hypothetical protein [Desulfobulbaceae bacterium]